MQAERSGEAVKAAGRRAARRPEGQGYMPKAWRPMPS